MNQLNTAVNFFDSSVNDALGYVNKNEYLSTALTLFLIVYAGVAAPKLPERIARLFDNTLFKVLIMFLIAYSARKNTTVAIVAAIGLMVSLHTLNRIKFFNTVNAIASGEEGMLAKVVPSNLSVQEGEMALEASVPEESLSELYEEGRPTGMAFGQAGCAHNGDFKSNFYPQYANLAPDAYAARFNGNDVTGYDDSSHASYNANLRQY